MSAAPRDAFLWGTLRLVLALTAISAVATHLIAGAGPALFGVLAGGAVGGLNFLALIWLGGRLVAATPGTSVFYVVLFLFKLLLVFGLVALVLGTLPVDALGFGLGCMLVCPAALLMLLWQSLQPAPRPQHTELSA